ncbi:MAG: hypothetical protein Q9228_000988 [Teloschistes exilis]
MASVEIAAPGLFARDIAAYSDAELDRYLEENGRFVDVEDPENLPDDFIQRLKDRTHRTSATTEARPVDPNQLAIVLQQCAARERSPSIATTASPMPEEEKYQKDLQYETKCYNALIEAGGRPSHPLNRLEDIIKDPGEYCEILSFWQGKYPREDEWRVFSIQVERWQDFQRLQRYARIQNGYDYYRSEWEDACKMYRLKYGDGPESRIYWGRGVYQGTEADWERRWQHRKKYSDRQVLYVRGYTPWWEFVQRKGRPIEGQGFLEYTEALKERLSNHRFTRTFQLDEDPARQDKLTTWIEYLGYEYWWYDELKISERGQQRHDEAWKKLVDSNVLKPGETEENLWGLDAGLRAASEEEGAEEAVQSAISAVSSAKRAVSKSQKSRLSAEQLQQRLTKAQLTLEAAMKRHESIKRRNDLISEFRHQTRDFKIVEREAECHRKLLHWVLQQVPLIEVELNTSNVARNDSGRRDCGRKRKRVEELDKEPNCPKQRHNKGDMRSIPDQKLHIDSTSQEAERGKLRTNTAFDDEPASKRHKGNDRTLRFPKPKISGHSTCDSCAMRKTRKLDTSESVARPSNARVKGSKASLDKSSPVTQTLRRSARIAKRLESTNIP